MNKRTFIENIRKQQEFRGKEALDELNQWEGAEESLANYLKDNPSDELGELSQEEIKDKVAQLFAQLSLLGEFMGTKIGKEMLEKVVQIDAYLQSAMIEDQNPLSLLYEAKNILEEGDLDQLSDDVLKQMFHDYQDILGEAFFLLAIDQRFKDEKFSEGMGDDLYRSVDALITIYEDVEARKLWQEEYTKIGKPLDQNSMGNLLDNIGNN